MAKDAKKKKPTASGAKARVEEDLMAELNELAAELERMSDFETERPPVEVKRLPHNLDLPLPTYESDESAGMDLRAAIAAPVVLAPGARALIPTGLAIALPMGLEAQVRPRSGLALKHGVTCLNSPGTIDSDYRGEVGVILINLGQEPFSVARGDRIAQLVIAPVFQADWIEVEELDSTERGDEGFGSTGKA